MAGTPANPVQMIQALLREQRFAEAESTAAALTRQHPGPQAVVIEAQVMARTRGAEAAVAALQGAGLRFPASPEVQKAMSLCPFQIVRGENDDARLEIALRGDVARHMMGLGRKGGLRPESWDSG